MNPDDCQEEDVEGCECQEGFVLSGENCVPRNKCGCSRKKDGKYFAVSIKTQYSNSDARRLVLFAVF